MIRKFMLKVANMSKKTSIIYLIVTTFLFVSSLLLLISGLILHYPGANEKELFISDILIIVGAVSIFLSIFFIALATIASNYLKKDKKKIQQTLEEIEKK